MNKIFVLSVFAVPFLTVQSYSVMAEDSHDNFNKTVLQCNSCHDSTATSKAENAPSLDGMEYDYLIEQLENFRFDKRGADTLSLATQEMSRQVKALQNDELSLIAGYYEDQPMSHSTETVAGDTNKLPCLVNSNFDLRDRIFNVSDGNRNMVMQARNSGCSAKFAGSGGAIVGTYEYEEQYQNLTAAMTALGCQTIKPEII